MTIILIILYAYIYSFFCRNSAYGGLLLDQSKFSKTSYVEGSTKLSHKVNSKEFKHYSEVDTDVYEVESSPSIIRYNMPIQLGFFVLQYAKLRMLQFYYDFIQPNLEHSSYQAIQMDTDSLYLGLSKRSFEDAIKPSMQARYNAMVHESCTKGDDGGMSLSERFVSRQCCDECKRWDRRVPGLFKVEQTGDEMIALCSKTYFVKDGDSYKMSAKGVNKNRVKKPHSAFLTVLNEQRSVSVENVGIRTYNHRVFTHVERKQGYSFTYIKRCVQPDMVSTTPLDMTLCPNSVVQCAICKGFTGEFINGSSFCHDCCEFLDECS